MRFRLNVWLGIALGGALAMFGAIGPAVADRPGTPTSLTVFDCGMQIFADNAANVCGTFKSAGTEEVTYESQITENGRPAGPGIAMDCPPRPFQIPHPACVLSGTKHEYQLVDFMLRHAKFDTTYCIAFRARRVSDQMVSQEWTSSVCAHTAPPPPPPPKPKISVQYFTSTVLGNVGPPQVDITFSPVPAWTDRENDYIQGDGLRYGQPNFPITEVGQPSQASFGVKVPLHLVYTVPKYPSADSTLTIHVCDKNVSGEACSTRIINATKQQDVSIDGALPIKITGRAPGQPLPPRPTSGFDGVWSVTTDQQTAFTMNMMLVNGAKMGAFTTTPDPADKLDMSGRLVDPTHAEMSFKEPGHIVFGTVVVTGTLGITLTNGGTAFIAIAQYSNNTTSVWHGTKTTPVAAR